MRTLPVHWHEGMFLRPHHFQAADRYWADQLRQGSRFDLGHNWGVRRIDLDLPALKNYRFVVNQLQARLRDGTVVRVPQDASLGELDLRKAFEAQETVQVVLAVPTLEVGRANVGGAGAEDTVRYRVEAPQGGVADENSGLNARPIQFRRMNLSLLLSTQDPAGYETLPLATLARSTQGEAVPDLYKPYIPPVLACDAWAVLKTDILADVYNNIARKVRSLADKVKLKGVTFQNTDPDARQMIERLQLLNEAAAVARLIARTDGLHPLPAYTELCRLVGRFAVFNAQSPIVPDLPDYDHDNLGECFFTAKRYLDNLINYSDEDDGVRQRPFVGSGLQMKVEMEESWLAPGWNMYVGVESNLQPVEVIALLTHGRTNLKIASANRVEEVYARGLRGMEFRHEPQPPRVLPATRSSTYFMIARSDEEWPHVQKDRAMAIRMNEGLLVGDLQGKRDLTFRGQPGRQPIMRFTLYIVPQRA